MAEIKRRNCTPYSMHEVRNFYNENYYHNEELGNIEVDILKRDFFNKEETKLTETQELLFKEVYSRLDAITGRHQIGVVINTKAILDENPGLGFDEKTMLISAALHDIGKTITPPEILQSSKRFTDAEFEIMDRHSVNAKDCFSVAIESINKKYDKNYTLSDFFDSPEMEKQVIDNCRFHHFSGVESVNDKDIPKDITSIKIIALSDVYESMASPLRAYKSILAQDDTIEIATINLGNLDVISKNNNLKNLDIVFSENCQTNIYIDILKYNDVLNDYILENFDNIATRENTTTVELFYNNKHLKSNEEVKEKMNLTTNFDFDKVIKEQEENKTIGLGE